MSTRWRLSAICFLGRHHQMRDLSLQMSKGMWDTAAWGNGPGDGASGEYTPGEDLKRRGLAG